MSVQLNPAGATKDACPLGIIEGFFGKSWSWADRTAHLRWATTAGYHFYIYAPKDDACLRRHWQTPWTETELRQLQTLAAECRAQGLAFGIGLTPLGAHHDYPTQREALLAKVRLIDAMLAPDILAVLFDDMPSDTPELAYLQLIIAHDIASESRASRLIFCPSFYSTDPILEKVFGAMPTHYWQDLGQGLDPQFDLFWTGPKVCSTEYPTEHLQWVREQLGRKPFLWDNYPVNDGRKASDYLYLRAFENRPASLANDLAGHAVNPMKQAWLSRLPLATLPLSYQQTAHYNPDAAWQQAANQQLGPELAALIKSDLSRFCDQGLKALSTQDQAHLILRYQPWAAHPAVAELLGWLAGEYAFDPACLTD